jgi:hypothetical protein
VPTRADRLDVPNLCPVCGHDFDGSGDDFRWGSWGIDLVRTAARAAESSCYGDATLIAARNWRVRWRDSNYAWKQAGDQQTGILTLSCRSLPECAK